MQQMHGIIPQLFDCWADPVAHLLLLKSSMVRAAVNYDFYALTSVELKLEPDMSNSVTSFVRIIGKNGGNLDRFNLN